MRYAAEVEGRTFRLELDARGRLVIEGEPVDTEIAAAQDGVFSVIVGGRSHEVVVLERAPRLRLLLDGRELGLVLSDEREAQAREQVASAVARAVEIRAPMPGLIVAVHVREGEVVEEGASLCTLEAMKMENELLAPRRARVGRLAAAAGAKVNGGDLLARLEPL